MNSGGILFTSVPGNPGDSNFDALGIPPQPILATRAGEKAKPVGEMTLAYRGIVNTEITAKAIRYINKNAGGDKPFFLYLPFINPHQDIAVCFRQCSISLSQNVISRH